jgi:predicted phosphate transport protein (TIGR00153 family)
LANVLANIFGKSPVIPLEKHVNISYRCTRELNPFFAAVVKEDWDKASKSRDKIVQLEHEADDLKKKIRLHLPKSLFMPVPRQDLLELLLVQDKMANRTKDVSGVALGRKMKIPAAIADDFLEFVARNVDAAKQARKSVRELDELFTSGFRGAEVSLVASLIEELDQIETDTDDREADLRSALFEIESELAPVDVIFLYRVIELTGEIADMAERVGRRLELLLSHN